MKFVGSRTLLPVVLAFFTRRTLAAFVDLDAAEHLQTGHHSHMGIDLTQLSSTVLNSTSALESAYSVAASMGLSREEAAQMGVEWIAAGLPTSKLFGGIDTECDGGLQFDTLAKIDTKAKYACYMKLRGMMSWRLDNDYFEFDNHCAKGWPKPQGSGPTFKGVRKLRESIDRYCAETNHKPFLIAYAGTGINPDINSDMWNARGGQPLYTSLPYETVDRLCLAFANIHDCEVKPLPDWFENLMEVARRANPEIQIYLTSSLASSQYKDGSKYCTDTPGNSDKLVQSLISVLDRYSLDGFDVDWENEINRTAYTSLLHKVNTAFKGTPFSLSMAVWPRFRSEIYDLHAIANNVESVSLMSYGGPPQTDLYFSEVVKTWVKGK